MNQKELKKRKSEIKSLYSKKDYVEAEDSCMDLVDDLFADKLYAEIVDLYTSGIC